MKIFMTEVRSEVFFHNKKLYIVEVKQLIFILLLSFSVNANKQDTCNWVAQSNWVTYGLDCTIYSNAPFAADSYQWVNCDNGYASIAGDTSSWYSGSTAHINIALIVSYLGCVDTSDCIYVCIAGLDELNSVSKELIKITDLMGRETKDIPNTPLIYIYSDGTTEKVFRVK